MELDMENATVEKELLRLEKKYWQAKVIHKPAFAAMLKAAPYTLHDFDVKDDVQVRLLSDDVAVLAYKVHEKLTVEGKAVTLDAADASTWIKRDGRWVCALHTESILGDPFGRDRQPAK
jgi:hypothetical protein